MAPKLYTQHLSPPATAVYLTANALGITLDHEEIDLWQNDHLKEEYLKLNPQHTIPVLEDEGSIIWDSHAINVYLVSKYGKDDSLYPNDPYKRAVVNQRLYFDSGMFALLRFILIPIKYKKVNTISQDLIIDVNQSYDFLNKFLEGQKWVTGDDLTLADFSLLSSTIALDIVIPMNARKNPNVAAWIKRVQQLPYYNIIENFAENFKAYSQRIMANLQ